VFLEFTEVLCDIGNGFVAMDKPLANRVFTDYEEVVGIWFQVFISREEEYAY
jgi:hypothetical protein